MRLHHLWTSALLISPALLAQHPTEIEPNDTAATATPINFGTQVEAAIVAGEQDWYSFTIASAQRVQMYTNGLDTRISLYDAAGTTLLAMDDDGRGSGNAFSSSLWLNLPAGTYKLRVEGYSSTTAGAYSVDLGTSPLKTYTQTEVEPNDVYTSANVVTIPAGGAQISGNIGANTTVLTDTCLTGSTATSVLASVPLTVSAYTGGLYQVRYTSGANAGLFRLISGNTATAITVAAFPNVPAAGDSYVVEKVDTDYYQITLTQPRVGLWFLITEGEVPSVYGHRYECYDANGVLLLASSTTASAYGTNSANSSSLSPRTSSIRVWPAGTYNIAVRYSNSQFSAPYNQIQTGNYCLEFFADMTIGTGSTVAEVEPNNSVATATPLTFGERGTGNITISTGVDSSDIWGPIVVPNRPVTVTFQSGRGSTTPIADTTVNILRPDGTTAATATTGNILDWTSHGRTSLSFNGGGTYYIQVLSPGTSTTTQQGEYVVEVSNMMRQPYTTSSWTTATSNTACGSPAAAITLTRAFASENPVLGSVFSRNVVGCPPSAFLFWYTGISTTLGNGSVPLPYDLTSLGAPGCTVNVDPTITLLLSADATGNALIDTNMPSLRDLRGMTLWEQAAVLNPAANSLGFQISNHARLILGDRSF